MSKTKKNKGVKPSDKGSDNLNSLRAWGGHKAFEYRLGSPGTTRDSGVRQLKLSVTLWHLLSLWASLSSSIKPSGELNSNSQPRFFRGAWETFKLLSNCHTTDECALGAFIHRHEQMPDCVPGSLPCARQGLCFHRTYILGYVWEE